MYNYICTECGHTFDDPHVYEEKHGFSHGPFEKWSVCPACGEPGYEETFMCDICDEVKPRSESNMIRNKSDGDLISVCDKCLNIND